MAGNDILILGALAVGAGAIVLLAAAKKGENPPPENVDWVFIETRNGFNIYQYKEPSPQAGKYWAENGTGIRSSDWDTLAGVQAWADSQGVPQPVLQETYNGLQIYKVADGKFVVLKADGSVSAEMDSIAACHTFIDTINTPAGGGGNNVGGSVLLTFTTSANIPIANTPVLVDVGGVWQQVGTTDNYGKVTLDILYNQAVYFSLNGGVAVYTFTAGQTAVTIPVGSGSTAVNPLIDEGNPLHDGVWKATGHLNVEPYTEIAPVFTVTPNSGKVPTIDATISQEIYRGYVYLYNPQGWNLEATPVLKYDLWADLFVQHECGFWIDDSGSTTPTATMLTTSTQWANPIYPSVAFQQVRSADGQWMEYQGDANKTPVSLQIDMRLAGVPLNTVKRIVFSFTSSHQNPINFRISNLRMEANASTAGGSSPPPSNPPPASGGGSTDGYITTTGTNFTDSSTGIVYGIPAGTFIPYRWDTPADVTAWLQQFPVVGHV